MYKIEVDRRGGEFGFEAKDSGGHTVRIDTSPETGGTNYGVRPMQMLLMAIGGCSGIDIVSILKKQRQTVDHFHLEVTGEREQGKDATLWTRIHIIFHLTGLIDFDKARKACELSMGKYCSVAATLRKAGCHISWETKVTPS
ncbi:MAG TPA: OsmC family protein [Puia sp.]|nr:OsmC family protein [Puia sp.]